MDLSKGLVTKLIDQDALNLVTRAGIDQSFLDEEDAPVLNYINRYYSDYKHVPSRDAVLKAFPNYEFLEYKEPLEYFVNELKEVYRRNAIEQALLDVQGIYIGSTKRAESTLRELLHNLSVTHKAFQDVDLAKSALERLDEYKYKQENPGADGILSGWQGIDYYTLGWHPEEFILLVGEKYQGKTWLMTWLAYKAMLQGQRVLFITEEMSQTAISRRFDSIYASVRFDSLRRGELTDVETTTFAEKMEELNRSNFHLTVAREGVNTLDEIQQKAIEVDATIVFIDSIYLYQPDNKTAFPSETARRQAISRKSKQTARSLGIPLIASTQAGRSKGNKEPVLDDIEWSNQFSQDADTVMMMHKDDVDKELNRLRLYLMKSRDGDTTVINVSTDFENMRFLQDSSRVEPTTEIEINNEETMFNA